MMDGPDALPYFQTIRLLQRFREPRLRRRHRFKPVSILRTQRRKRAGERAAGAVGVFRHDARSGKARRAFAGKEPVGAFGVIQMPAFHQHRATAERQQRLALLAHLRFAAGVGGFQQRRRLRQIRRDDRHLRQ